MVAVLLVVGLGVVDGKGKTVVAIFNRANKFIFGLEVVTGFVGSITDKVLNGGFCLDFLKGKLPRLLENLEKELN